MNRVHGEGIGEGRATWDASLPKRLLLRATSMPPHSMSPAVVNLASLARVTGFWKVAGEDTVTCVPDRLALQ